MVTQIKNPDKIKIALTDTEYHDLDIQGETVVYYPKDAIQFRDHQVIYHNKSRYNKDGGWVEYFNGIIS